MSLKRFQNYFFILPVVCVTASLFCILMFGLRPGIDLAGGSFLQVTYPDGRPSSEAIQDAVQALDLGEVRVQPANAEDYILRQRSLTEDEKTRLDDTLATFGTVEEVQYNSVGPSIGSELMRKAWWAIGLVILTTILYIAFAFRGVSKPVASWKYGMVAIITLAHDVVIPMGLFAFLGYTTGAEVGSLFIVALLTILGISINDTIVIFDRIRENLMHNERDAVIESYADVVWKSIVQTMARSVNTSLTVIMMLLALMFLGPEATDELALTLTVGMIAGTYSSIFLAAPLLVLIEKYQKPPKANEEPTVQTV